LKENIGCQNKKTEYISKEYIIETYEKTIDFALFQTNPNERQDLKQELYTRIFEKLRDLDFKKDAPSFWGYFEEN